MEPLHFILALVAVVCLWTETEQNLIRFEDGFEYQYTYDSKSTMDQVGQFHIRGKLGYVPFAEHEDGQELLVRVHSFHIKNRDTEVSEGWDLSEWFSFVINPRGEVLRTYHPEDEDAEVLAMKKGFASLISGKFYVEHEGVVKHDDGQWSYRIKEYGQEGHHNATYKAERTKSGIKFTKTREGHPVYNAKSDYQKEMHYHPQLKIIHQVYTKENFASPREPPKNFDAREGLRPTLQEDNRPQDQVTLPDMRATTNGQLTFVTRIRVKQKIKRPAEEVTEGETHIGHVPKKVKKLDFSDALSYVKGNLTCLRKAPEGPNGGHDSMRCSNNIVSVLTAVEPAVVTKLIQQFFNMSSRQRRFPWKYGPDQKSLIDVLCNWKEPQGVDLLTDMVFRSPLPNPAHLEHLFIAMVTSETMPTKKFLQTLEEYILDPKSFPILAQGQDVYRHALLCFGSMAGFLKDKGLMKESQGMIAKVEKMLGLHDPWLFREKRSTMTEADQLDHETHKVILLESLGNAALESSVDHILSHINTTSTKWIKRSGLHALRNYHTDKVAQILWATAFDAEDDVIGREARALYQLHPKADKGMVQAMSAHESGPLIRTLQQHPRYARSTGASMTVGKSIWDGIAFKINAPGINWIKQFGSPDIGIAFGLILANGLNLTLTPLESDFSIVVHDEFYVRMVLGCIGLNIDLFVVRVCFKGKAKLDLNVFQEFSPEKLQQKYNQFMDIADRVYNTMVTAVDEVKGITDSGDQFTNLLEQLMDTLEAIPDKIAYLKMESLNATVLVGEMWDWKLPAWAKSPAGPIAVIKSTATLFKDISDGVMNFYNAVREPIMVTLPNSFMAIWNNLKELVSKFDYIKEDPMGFVKVCFKVVFSVSRAVIEVLYAVKKVQTTAFFIKKEPPAWMKIRTLYIDLFNKIKGVNGTTTRKRGKWVNAATVGEDPVKKMTNGNVTSQQMRGQVMDRIQGILTHMLNVFLDLLPLPDSFIDAYLNFYNMVAKVKKAYAKLKAGYDFVTTVIDRVMGVKSHKRFPKTFRTASDDCPGTGFYPSELQMVNPTPAPPHLTRQNAVSQLGVIPQLTRSQGTHSLEKRDTWPDGTYKSGYHAEYSDNGVDLVVDENSYIVAPFPGQVTITDVPNQVRIKVTGNSLKYTYIFITHVVPNNTIPYMQHTWAPKVEVSAGQVIGISALSPCAGKNHIHVSFRKYFRYLDPTRFIEERSLPLPKWNSECDDYKAVWKIRVVKAGSIIGLVGKKIKERKSPQRVPSPDAVSEPEQPAPAEPAAENDPAKVTESMTTGQTLKTGIKNTQDAIVQDFTDMKQALSWSTIREKMRNFTVCSVKLGVIFEFMSQFGLTDSMTSLSETLIFFRDFNTKKWCINPHTLTVDELKAALTKRGLSSMGSKGVLIKRFTAHTQNCPLLQFKMPKNIFCTYDSLCLGTTCCMTFNFVYFIKTIDFYARFDPCEFQFVVGFGKAYTQPWRNWNPREPDLQGMQSAEFKWSLTDVFFGEEGTKYTNIKTDIADSIVLSIRYNILKSEKEMMASVSAGFCFEDNLANCIEPFEVILKDAVFPIPICNTDGSMTWPVVDYKSYFDRAEVAEALKEEGRVVEAAQKQAAIDAFLSGFGLPESFAIPTAPCARPERKTLAQLETYYNAKSFSAEFTWDATDLDGMVAATILADKKCTTSNGGVDYSLPSFDTAAMDSTLYPTMASGCNQIDLCIDLNSTAANVTKSIDANIDLNYCDYVITVSLGGVSQTFLMFLYPWGENQMLQIGDNVAMNYTINRDLDAKEFNVDVYLRIYSNNDSIVDGYAYQNLVVPMLNCSQHIPFPLPGDDLVGFLDELEGHNMTEEAFDAILTQYRLGPYRQERVMEIGSCVNVTLRNSTVSCASNLSAVNFLSPEMSLLANCGLSSTCHGVQCCIDLPFQVNGFSNTNYRHTWVSFEFHECNYTIDIRIGSHLYSARLLQYDWGRTIEGSIGISPNGLMAPIRWSANINVPASETAKVLVERYTIDLNVSFCIPLNDTTNLCVPDVDGFTLLRQFEVQACHNDTSLAIKAEVDSQSVNEWMNLRHAAADVSLGEAGVEQFLDETGLVYLLQNQPCDPMRGIYDPAASGWNRIGCSSSLPNFLELPDNVRCYMSSMCSDIDCCMTVDMFGMMTRTIHSTFKVDTCAYELSGSIELMRFSFTLFFYDWGAVKTYNIRDIFYIQFAIDRDTIARTVTVDLNLKMCLEPNSPCDIDIEIFKQTVIPMADCNLAEIVSLPPGYTIRTFIPAQGLTLGDTLTDEIEEAILRHLGLATTLTPTSKLYCETGYSADYSHCSTFTSLSLTQVSSCRMDNRCYGFECCFDLDLEFLSRASRLHAYVDPCDYKLAIMWDDYSFNRTLYTFPWGEHRVEQIGTSVYLNYTISKSATLFTLSVAVYTAIEDFPYTHFTVLDNAQFPIPQCDYTSPYDLGKRLPAFAEEILTEGPPSDYAWEAVFRSLGLYSLMDEPCPANTSLHYCPHLADPSTFLPSYASCHYDELCLGLHCCLDVNFYIGTRRMKAWTVFNPCTYELSYGLERFSYDAVLPDMAWGQTFQNDLSSNLVIQVSVDQPSAEVIQYDSTMTLFTESYENYKYLNATQIPTPTCNTGYDSLSWTGGSFDSFVSLSHVAAKVVNPKTEVFQRLYLDQYFFDMSTCSLTAQTSPSHTCSGFVLSDGSKTDADNQCQVSDGCLKVECCALNKHMMGNMSLNLDFSVELFPCDYSISFKLEAHTWTANIFENFGQVNNYTIANALVVQWTLESNSRGSLKITVDILNRVDGYQNGRTSVLSNALLELPTCDTAGTLTWPATSNSAAEQILGEGADVLLSLLNVDTNFFRHAECAIPTPNHNITNGCPHLDMSNLPSSVNCSHVETCTGLECCISVDIDMVTHSYKTWAIIDPCDYSISFGFEQWQFNDTLIGYTYGTPRTVSIASTIVISYTVNITDDLKRVLLTMSLMINAADYGLEIPEVVIFNGIPVYMPACDENRTLEYTNELLGQTYGRNVTVEEAPSGIAVNRLGVRPEVLTGVPCVDAPTPDAVRCPHVPSIPATSDATHAATCSAGYNKCTSIHCCVEMQLGVAPLAMTMYLELDPCTFVLSAGFEKVYQNTTYLGDFGWGIEQELVIGESLVMKYKVEKSVDERDFFFTLKLSTCQNCTDGFTVADQVQFPIPSCEADGSFRWPSSDSMTVNEDTVEMPSALIMNRMGIQAEELFADECSSPGQSASCPFISIGSMPSDVQCGISDKCTGVECCVTLDLKVVRRNFRVWTMIDPCDYILSVGFERHSFNVSLLGYNWGVERVENVGAFDMIYNLSKSANNHAFTLDMSFYLCLEGVCSNFTILNGTSFVIPYCDATTHAISWPTHLYSNLLSNVLGVTNDFLMPLECSPTTVPLRCRATRLPQFGSSNCYVQSNCMGVLCCFEEDLLVEKRNMYAWFEIFHCQNQFGYAVENYNKRLSLSSVSPGVLYTDTIGESLTLTYSIDETPTSYNVFMALTKCWRDVDGNQGDCLEDVIMDGTMFSKPTCARRRRRRAANLQRLNTMYDTSSAATANNVRAAAGSGMTNTQTAVYFGSPNTTKPGHSAAAADAAAKKFGNFPSMCNYKSAAQFGAIMVSPDQAMVSDENGAQTTIKGAASMNNVLGANAATTTAKDPRHSFHYKIGFGPTSAGNTYLGGALANMTVGQFEASININGMPPTKTLKLFKDLTDVFVLMAEEFINNLLDGKGADGFAIPDITLKGQIPMPKKVVNIFSKEKFFLLGGMVPMTFGMGFDTYYGLNITVSAKVVKMTAGVLLKPFFGFMVWGELGIGALIYGKLRLEGDICEVGFPLYGEINFGKSPLAVGGAICLEIVPVRLRLFGMVTIEVDLGLTTIEEIAFKKLIWSYASEPITFCAINETSAVKDNSPPQFTGATTTNMNGKRDATAENCEVEQLPDRDYTEPAFEISVVASDDRSEVRLFLDVGTVKGGDDTIKRRELGGPTTVLVETLANVGVPLYFTVSAENDGGGSAKVTCELPSYDITEPTGRVLTAFQTTSNPRILRGSALALEDSTLTSQRIGLGFGKDIYGDQILPWTEFTVSQNDGITAPAGSAHFTDMRLGRLNAPVVTEMQQNSFEDCARECLTKKPWHCMAFNYDMDYDLQTCQLLSGIEGGENTLSESGFFYYFERLGAGHAVEFNEENLWMTHNELIYHNVQFTNYLNYTCVLSSEATLVDLTPPEPGLISNAESDEMRWETCHETMPDNQPEWPILCREQSTEVLNHRWIRDGPGSMTVFNGHRPLVDLLYTRANKYISANWDGIHDDETGVHGYSWGSGTTACEEMIHVHEDPHINLFSEAQWDYKGVLFPLPAPFEILEDGRYYITVRALNKVEFGGPLALSVCHMNPYIIDNTRPIFYEIYNIGYKEETHTVFTSYNATDDLSGIQYMDFCLGETTHDCNVMEWLAVDYDDNYSAEAVFNLLHIDFPVWPKLQAVNGVNLTRIKVSPYPLLIDMTPPIAGTVIDGNLYEVDITYQKDADRICTNWYGFYDAESGISSYMVAVGTTPNGTDISTGITLGNHISNYCVDLPSDGLLQHNTMYYSTVWAYNSGHKQLNTSATSNGVLVDLTAPLTGEIVDGLEDDFTDIEYNSNPATVDAQWRDYSDPESGIMEYSLQVEVASNMSFNYDVAHAWDAVSKNDSSIEWHHFHLHHRDRVRTRLRTTNHALNDVTTSSDSFIVDRTPPVVTFLGDGSTLGVDRDYQSDKTQFSSNWEFFDEESGLDHSRTMVYQMHGGSKLQFYPTTRGVWSMESDPAVQSHTDILDLTTGAHYSSKVASTNRARLSAPYHTDGVIIDDTAPHMQFVHTGAMSGASEEIVEENVWQADPNGIRGSWLGIDGESGVSEYFVAVGLSPGDTSVSDWRTMGDKTDGYIGGLSLTLADPDLKTPQYYISVKALNGAGLECALMSGSPLLVVDEDKIGFVIDGAGDTEHSEQAASGVDIDYQADTATLTCQWDGFESTLHGIRHYEWAVGLTPRAEDVKPYMGAGIIPREHLDPVGKGLPGAGKASSPLDLKHGQTYYCTIRAFTGGENLLEAVSDGFIVDLTPPTIELIDIGLDDNSTDLTNSSVHYQISVDSLSGEWEYEEDESKIVQALYAYGTYPGSDDIYPWTNVGPIPNWLENSVPIALVKPEHSGMSNILTVKAFNNLGYSTQIHSGSIVVDTTPPVEGTVVCPETIPSATQLECTWSGFYDSESPITAFTFGLGTQELVDDVYTFATVDASKSKHVAKSFLQPLVHQGIYYASVTAVNSVGKVSTAFSQPITIDNTPPVHGTIVELPGIYYLALDSPGAVDTRNTVICNTTSGCSAIDATCQESLTQIAVVWTAFSDPESQITRYQLAVGSTPGGGQVLQFFDVELDDPNVLNYVISGLDMIGLRQVFVTVKGFNEAGLSSVAISNGVFLAYTTQGLAPLYVYDLFDTKDETGDMDYQVKYDTLSGRWDFSGDPCPMASYSWSIERLDGTVVQDPIDLGTQTFGDNDNMMMSDYETYFILVNATNVLGFSQIMRSDGIAIQKDPLYPGTVNDGDVTGFDLLYWPFTDKITANWDHFGVQNTASFQPQVLSGNPGLAEEEEQVDNKNQGVDYYEIAIGTDRRYPKSRDNVVPYTNVGRNLSHTFFDLDLVPLTALYYVTIRAHSFSQAVSEVTSNGFFAGYNDAVLAQPIQMRDYWNNASYLTMHWDPFTASPAIMYYHVGLSNHSMADSYNCKELIEGGDVTTDQKAELFNVVALTNLGTNSMLEIFNMSLVHNSSYYVMVIGVNEAGKCNSSSYTFTIDLTNVEEGRLRNGPYYDQNATYTDSLSEITLVWEGYHDPTSGIKTFELSLWTYESCSLEHSDNASLVVDWITLDGTYTGYTFTELTLVLNKPYFVIMRTTNWAYSHINTTTVPILVDTSVPTAGNVIDGLSYLHDARWNGFNDFLEVSFLHWQDGTITACADTPIDVVQDPNWSKLAIQGLLMPSGAEWNIVYIADEVQPRFDGNGIQVRMIRDTKASRMYSGAYSINADFASGGKYQVDIQAGNGTGRAITSLLFWDGPASMIGEYLVPMEEDWAAETCRCCYYDPVPVDCICNCTEYMAVLDFYNITLPPEPTTTMTPNAAPVPWAIQQVALPGDNVDHIISNMPQDGQPSCGFQLHPGTPSYINLWCRFANDTYEIVETRHQVEFDLTVWNTYEIEFYEFYDQSTIPTRCVHVKLATSDEHLASLCGIPQLSNSTRMIFHVFNSNNYVPPLTDTMNPWSVTSYLREVRLPPSSDQLCRYGNPFMGGTNPIISYEAAVGYEAGTEDVVAFTPMLRPCVPCGASCSRYLCTPGCDGQIMEKLVITIPDLELSYNRTIVNMTGFNTTEQALYHVSVKAVLASGENVITSSNGVGVDITQPTTEEVFYIDVARDPYAPINFMSSNTTVKALWTCSDEESGITENLWAIGSYPGGTDIQDFVSVGEAVTGTNDGLAGFIQHNVSLYVSVRCVNGGGLSNMIIDTAGILPLLIPPSADDVASTLPDAQSFPVEVNPPNTYETEDPTTTGATWTLSSDVTIRRYEYCLGSSNTSIDDLFPCTWVGYNTTGKVEIKNGYLTIDDIQVRPLSEFRAPEANNSMPVSTSNFQMEVGRALFTHMKLCNEAEVCVVKFVGTTMVVDAGSQLETATEGGSISASLTAARRKRSTGDTFAVNTPSGLEAGQSILLGELSAADLSTSYSSDASANYQSYIVNPADTSDMLQRQLDSRVQTWPTSGYYISPVGGLAMPGALEVTVSYDASYLDAVADTRPALLHWDSDNQNWAMSEETCTSESNVLTYDSGATTITTKVCSTRENSTTTSSSSRRKKRSTTSSYFDTSTMFVVASISTTITNNAPNLTSLTDLWMDEDAGTLVYTMTASDVEGDTIIFELDSSLSSVTTGSATLASDGTFTYQPCTDCHGMDYIAIIVTEDQTGTNITAASAYYNISMNVSEVADSPSLAFSQYGINLFPSDANKSVIITVDKNHWDNIAYSPYTFLVLGYDQDDYDNLTIIVDSPSSGTILVGNVSRDTVTLPSSCPASSAAADLPCSNINLDHASTSYKWAVSSMTYTPNVDFYGWDEFRIMIGDSTGLYSDLLHVYVAVLENPCQHNGTCVGPSDDPSCTTTTRALGYSGYSCSCTDGWTGDYCQTDIDDCTSAPCNYPMACYDMLNGYRCACPQHWPNCEVEFTAWMATMAAVFVLIILGVVGGVLCYKFRLKSKRNPQMKTKAYYDLTRNRRNTMKKGIDNKALIDGTIPGTIGEDEEYTRPPTSASMYSERNMTPVPRISRPDSVLSGKFSLDGVTRGESSDDAPSPDGLANIYKGGLMGRLKSRVTWQGLIDKTPKIPLPWGLNINKSTATKTSHIQKLDETSSTSSWEDSDRAPTRQSIYSIDSGPSPPPMVSFPGAATPEGYSPTQQMHPRPLTTVNKVGAIANVARPSNATRIGSATTVKTVTSSAPSVDRSSKPSSGRPSSAGPSVDRSSKPSRGSSASSGSSSQRKSAWSTGQDDGAATYDLPPVSTDQDLW